MVNDSTAGLKFILDLKFLDNIIDGYEAATFIGRTKIDKTTSPTWILWFGMNVEANRFDTSAIFKFIKLLNYQILKLFVSDFGYYCASFGRLKRSRVLSEQIAAL